MSTVTDAYLLDGTLLRHGDVKLNPLRVATGQVQGVLRETTRFGLRVAEQLPEGEQLRGKLILVTFPDRSRVGYTIDRIDVSRQGSVVIVADDPGFAMYGANEIEMLYYPQRQLTGPPATIRF